MFEKFSESTRRAIFFARREASAFGTEKVTTELLLLGMLHENAPEISRLIGIEVDSCEEFRRDIERSVPHAKPVPLSVDMSVSKELGRVFRCAVEEISDVGIRTVQHGHLLIGILREDCRAADLLRNNGAELELIRQRMQASRCD